MATTSIPKGLALITGATGGIGKATAIALAKEGYNLALHYNNADMQTREDLMLSIKQQASFEANVAFFQADMSDYDSVRQLHKDVVAHAGQVDVLFNNAGTTGGISGPQSLSDVPIDVFDKTWKINTGSAILLTQLCLPHMDETGAQICASCVLPTLITFSIYCRLRKNNLLLFSSSFHRRCSRAALRQ